MKPDLHQVVIHGATELHGNRPTPVTIVIKEPFPECRTLEEAEALHDANAENLVKALYEALPQGTLHKVLYLLMERYSKRMLYRGTTE